MNTLRECSVRTCRNLSDARFKMCKRCRDAEAKRAVKKRQKRRAKRVANGETIRTRAPDRPRPPLYRIPLPDGNFQLYTERDWEHLDERLFDDQVLPDRPHSEHAGVIDLIPIKICSRKSCHQPLPASIPKTACGFCSRRNLRPARAVPEMKHKRNDDHSLVLAKVEALFESYNKVDPEEEQEQKDDICCDFCDMLGQTTYAIIVPILVDALEDPSKIKLALEALEVVAYRDDYPFREELEVLLPKLISILQDFDLDPQPRATLTALFRSELVLNAAASQLDRTLSRIIELLRDASCNFYLVLDFINEIANDDAYRHQIATAIPRLIELLMNSELPEYETWLVTSILSSLSKDATYLGDIAPAIPRLIELLQEQDFSCDGIVLALSRVSSHEEFRAVTAPALEFIIGAISERIKFSEYDEACVATLEFFANHSKDPTNVTQIRKILPWIAKLSSARAEKVRNKAVNTLFKLAEQGIREEPAYILDMQVDGHLWE